MSYVAKPKTRRALAGYRVPGRAGLAGSFDDIMNAAAAKLGYGDAPNPACDAAGRAAQAPYDAQMKDVASSWANRDGFFTIDDATAIVQKGLAFQAAGQKLLDQLDAAYGQYGQSSLKQARDQAFNDLIDVGKNANDFLAAINDAIAKGASIIDAPGLKGWIIDCIGAASYCAYVAAYVKCAMPDGAATILFVMQTFTAAGNAFITVVKKAAVVVATAGDVIYKTTVGALDLAATVVKYAPLIGIGLAGLWLYKNRDQVRRRVGV